MRRRALLGAVAAVSVAGCIDRLTSGSDRIQGGDIGMSAHSFIPEEYHTTVGETVTWINSSSRGHTVTAYDDKIPADASFFSTGEYESTAEAVAAWHEYGGGRIDVGETFSHTFEVPGTYEYFCEPHVLGGMIGRVIVDE